MLKLGGLIGAKKIFRNEKSFINDSCAACKWIYINLQCSG